MTDRRTEREGGIIHVDNLISAVSAVIDRPEVPDEAFVICDAEVTATAGLIRLIADALGLPPHLPPTPQVACLMLGRAIGKADDIERLFELLQVDVQGFVRRLHWQPHICLDDGVQQAIAAWHERRWAP